MAGPECPLCHGPCLEWGGFMIDDQQEDHEFNDRKELVIPAGGLSLLRRPRGEPARADDSPRTGYRTARGDERRAALAYGLACDQRDAWEELAMGLDHLLAHYRSGTSPSGALLDRIKKTREQVAALKQEACDA